MKKDPKNNNNHIQDSAYEPSKGGVICSQEISFMDNAPEDMNIDQQLNLMIALNDVKKERLNQFKKWGEQNFPNFVVKSNWGFLTPSTAQKRCEERTELGTVSMMDIFYEELCEMVYVLDDPDELEKELIQVVAVGVQWLEKLRRDKVNHENLH